MSRVSSDTTLLRDVTTGSIVGVVTGGVTLIATLVLMSLLDRCCSASPWACSAWRRWSSASCAEDRPRRPARAGQRGRDGRGAGTDAGRVPDRQGVGRRTARGQRIHAAAREAWRADIRAAKWEAIAGNTAGLSIQCAFIAVLATGGARVASGAIEVGTLVAFLLYVYYLMSPIQQLVSAATEYQVGARGGGQDPGG